MADKQQTLLLPVVLQAWNSSEFNAVAKQEIEKLKLDRLPLQQGLSNGSYALDTSLNVVIINSSETGNGIQIKAGIFYTSMIAGCNCADDPSPAEEINEFCVVTIDIDKPGAETTITLS